MESERMRLLPVANAEKPAMWPMLFSLGMKWGLFPMVQEWALAGVGRWVYNKVSGTRSRR